MLRPLTTILHVRDPSLRVALCNDRQVVQISICVKGIRDSAQKLAMKGFRTKLIGRCPEDMVDTDLCYKARLRNATGGVNFLNIQQDSNIGSNDFDVVEVFDANLNRCYTNYHIIAIYL